jgi:hypothetical protein
MRHAFVFAFLLLLAAPLYAQDAPVPPRDAEWTIYCASLAGPDRVREAKNLRIDLPRRTGLRDWYVVQGDTDSKVFYGYYRTIDSSAQSAADRKEAARAKSDLHKIQEFTGPNGEHPFARAAMVQIIPPDPQGPPEWNLLNVNRNKPADHPTRAYYTLQIAAYKDSPERKQAAVDSVREFRKRGIEAYYHHGETVSEVCIGAWPRSAMSEQGGGTDTAGGDQPVIVFNTPLSPSAIQKIEESHGGNAKVIAPPQIKPVDPSLQRTMQEYPDLYINGEIHVSKVKNPETGQIETVKDHSLIVHVPEPDASSVDAPPIPQIAPPPPALARPPTPSGTGKLKSLDE